MRKTRKSGRIPSILFGVTAGETAWRFTYARRYQQIRPAEEGFRQAHSKDREPHKQGEGWNQKIEQIPSART